MQAYNRPLHEWFKLIELGQLTLPKFQRFEAWSYNEISNLLRSMLRGLPTGAALILRVDGEEQFRSKYLAGAPKVGRNVTEQLLDGQQRLTAMWKSLHNLYTNRTYLVSIDKATINNEINPSEYLKLNEIEVVAQAIYDKKGNTYPMWVNDPRECWARGLIPVSLLRPVDISKEKKAWLKASAPGDYEMQEFLDDLIDELRDRIKHFNLPYLELPSTTKKHVALDVFIKLNTSSVKLTAYDIVVALVEDSADVSLHDKVDTLGEKIPKLKDYVDIPDLVLDTTALLQNIIPSQAGYTFMNFKQMIDDWDDLEKCFALLVDFLEEEHIFDESRLPSYTVLPVLAALMKYLPTNSDQLGNVRHLLKKYMWRAFLTDRYEKTTTTNSLIDYRKLRDHILGLCEYNEIPIFNQEEYPAPAPELIRDANWPKNRTILGRALLALQFKCGAYDIADNTPANKSSILKREYHHLFPDALLKKADLPSSQIYCAMNCALISWRTNRTISDKSPKRYLLERIENCSLGDPELKRRLRSHLIPFKELNVDYQDLDDPETKTRIREDYTRFLDARAALLQQAAQMAYDGEVVTAEWADQSRSSE